MSTVTLSISPNVYNKSNESEKILRQLLECVQDCQKRYGGKTELATELDSCVTGLCFSLEAIFCHGLRNKSLHSTEHSSALKQVSEIVTNSFSSNGSTCKYLISLFDLYIIYLRINPFGWFPSLMRLRPERFNILI